VPFGLQPIHLVVIFVVALLIFGPRRLPEIGRGVGKAINEFRKGTLEMTESLKDEISKPTQEAQAAAAGAPAPSIAPLAHAEALSPQAEPAQFAPAQTATGNFCSQCGNPNPAEARFCNKCGSKLAV
jgi:TatA/E family protein of Tat protein translocase